MNDRPRPSAELAARRTVAAAVLSEYEAERNQVDHLTDWLSLAVKLSNALRGLLDAGVDDVGNAPGRLHLGGGWISGSST